MNLILLDSLGNKQNLPASDRRSVHIRKILGGKPDNGLFVGFPNGPLGKATVVVASDGSVELEVTWLGLDICDEHHSCSGELLLIIPYCRPQTCRKILRDAASVGLAKLVFFVSDKAEQGYAESSLWESDEWRQQLMTGVEQAFDTYVPEVIRLKGGLEDALDYVGKLSLDLNKIALDNYEAETSLGGAQLDQRSCVFAIGPERGWSASERKLLKNEAYVLAHMGAKVMRAETAVIAASSVLHSRLGGWDAGDTGDAVRQCC